MPPKASSSSSGASSSKRHAAQTKSTRQQSTLRSQGLSVSHGELFKLQGRGLKCVDEYGEVKSVKLLRRGRRLQQVEAVYGRDAARSESPPSRPVPAPAPQSVIPQLMPEFFHSPFWRRFSLQRPVIDPTEFTARFFAHAKGSTTALGPEGKLLASILVIWAAAFGVDEYGNEDRSQDPLFNGYLHGRSSSPVDQDLPGDARNSRHIPDALWVKEISERRRHRLESMLREALHLVDLCGVVRRPTWDGVRVLLLIAPLLENVQSPLDSVAFRDAAIAQVHTLCTLAPPPSAALHSFATINGTDEASLLRDEDGYTEALIKARIFWYAHIQEGLATGLRGGRLTLTEDDLETFQDSLPSLTSFPYHDTSRPSSARLPSPISPTSPTTHSSSPTSRLGQTYLSTAELFALPLALGTVCRRVHEVLSGPKARRRQATFRRGSKHAIVNEEDMAWIWESLEQCWDRFEDARQTSVAGMSSDDVGYFVSTWQLAIFDCYNVIRESLKSISSGSAAGMVFPPSPSSPGPQSGFPSTAQAPPPFILHVRAVAKCQHLLPRVLLLIQHELSVGGGIFRFDAGICRDGVFFAGLLAAGAEGHILDGSSADAENAACLAMRALTLMRFSCNQTEPRHETIRSMLESRSIGPPPRPVVEERQRAPAQATMVHQETLVPYQREAHSREIQTSRRHPLSPPHTSGDPSYHAEPWSSYTPPTTGHTGSSSPGFHHQPIVFKEEEVLYHASEFDQFSFHVPQGLDDYVNPAAAPYLLSHEEQPHHFPEYTYLADTPVYPQNQHEYYR